MIQGENFEIKETITSFPADTDNWSVELNLVSWYGKEAKYEIRKWDADHTRFSKGVTLSEDEVILLFQRANEILSKISGEEIPDTPVEDSKSDKNEKDDIPQLPFT